MTRRGNTHESFAPVSVYKTRDGYAYIAVGNDIQWERMLKIPGFEGLANPNYLRNEGRIGDVENLNRAIEGCTVRYTTAELIGLFTAATMPISKVNSIEEVIEDPYVKKEMLSSTDARTGRTIYLAPPPYTTSYVRSVDRRLQFPPRFGEHNGEIYVCGLGYSQENLEQLKGKGVI